MIGGKIALTCLVIFLVCVVMVLTNEKGSKVCVFYERLSDVVSIGLIIGLLLKIWGV